MIPATPNSYAKNARRRLSVQYGSKCATLRTSRCPIPAKPQNLATLCRPCLIAADWHLRNPDKNDGLLSLKVLFRSSRWAGSSLRTSDVTSTRTIMSCSLIIVTTKRTSSDTPLSSCLRISRYPPLHSADSYVVRLVLPLIRTSIRTRYFFEYTLTGYLDDEGEGKGGSLLRAPAPVPAETTSTSTSAMVEAKAEVVIVEGPKPNRREVNGTSNTRGGARQKPLRRECSRLEV